MLTDASDITSPEGVTCSGNQVLGPFGGGSHTAHRHAPAAIDIIMHKQCRLTIPKSSCHIDDSAEGAVAASSDCSSDSSLSSTSESSIRAQLCSALLASSGSGCSTASDTAAPSSLGQQLNSCSSAASMLRADSGSGLHLDSESNCMSQLHSTKFASAQVGDLCPDIVSLPSAVRAGSVSALSGGSGPKPVSQPLQALLSVLQPAQATDASLLSQHGSCSHQSTADAALLAQAQALPQLCCNTNATGSGLGAQFGRCVGSDQSNPCKHTKETDGRTQQPSLRRTPTSPKDRQQSKLVPEVITRSSNRKTAVSRSSRVKALARSTPTRPPNPTGTQASHTYRHHDAQSADAVQQPSDMNSRYLSSTQGGQAAQQASDLSHSQTSSSRSACKQQPGRALPQPGQRIRHASTCTELKPVATDNVHSGADPQVTMLTSASCRLPTGTACHSQQVLDAAPGKQAAARLGAAIPANAAAHKVRRSLWAEPGHTSS